MNNLTTPIASGAKPRKLDFNTTGNAKSKAKIFLTKETKKEHSKKVKCSCKKSNCLKGYCVCYANGEKCSGCDCTTCENDIRTEVIEVLTIAAPDHCKCTNSNCVKRYCECYRQGKSCDSSCRCKNCQNVVIQVKEEPLGEEFKVNRIRVMITGDKIYMNEEIENMYNEIVKHKRTRKNVPAAYEKTPKGKGVSARQSTCDKTQKKRKRNRKDTRQVKRKLLVN
jgi:hypothetical protein